jgi:hypothetical protein
MRRLIEVVLAGIVGAVIVVALSRTQASRVVAPLAVAQVVAQAQPTPPLQTTPIQGVGRQLLECREMRAQAFCVANEPVSGACARAHEAITGDGIFIALRDMTDDSLCDVVARVDAAMVECAQEMGIEYQRKVW